MVNLRWGLGRTHRSTTLLIVVVLVAACAGTQPSRSSMDAPPSTASPSPAATVSPAPSATGTEDVTFMKADVARAGATTEDAKAAATAINEFGIDLYRELSEDAANVVFSPASIAIALGMARAGARGNTASQIDAVLRDVASEDHAAWLNGLDQALTSRSGTYEDDEGAAHELILDIANAYFAQHDYPLETAFLESLAARFGAGMQLVDFVADPENGRRLINEWASEQTRGRIPEVLQSGDVTSDTRLALVNAIYLKAPWLRPFQSDQTTDEPFTRPDGSTVEVPTMRTAAGSCGTGPDWGAFELPYLGNTLAMLVIVPDDLAAFETTLNDAVVRDITIVVREGFATPDITFPRFAFETRAELARVLAQLGMPNAFDPEAADFSGMTGERDLFISKVIHQANISVDERGTEAAAVTVIGMDTTGGPTDVCTVHADRPFLFALRDVETGAILFMGRVVDPSAS